MTNNRTISVKNDNDLTARQLLRVIEIQIFASDFENAAYSSMRSLLPQLSIECCFFSLFGEANWRKISDAHPNIWKFLEVLKYRVEEASSPPWGIFVKKI